jgi:secondary thiamine-phosphate synthase enzyme
MMIHRGGFEFETRGEFHVVDLTEKVEQIVSRSEVREGIVLVYAGHATGVIILNEYEGSLLEDVKDFLRKLAPSDIRYHHYGNAHAHLRSMLFEPSKVLPIRKGRLGLGTWQRIFWVETETRCRKRQVEVTIIGE